jgi:hypothetical protein
MRMLIFLYPSRASQASRGGGGVGVQGCNFHATTLLIKSCASSLEERHRLVCGEALSASFLHDLGCFGESRPGTHIVPSKQTAPHALNRAPAARRLRFDKSLSSLRTSSGYGNGSYSSITFYQGTSNVVNVSFQSGYAPRRGRGGWNKSPFVKKKRKQLRPDAEKHPLDDHARADGWAPDAAGC